MTSFTKHSPGFAAAALAELLRWGPALLIMTVIFYASSMPDYSIPNFQENDLFVKKGGHLLVYLLLNLAFLRGMGQVSWRSGLSALLLTLCFAASDELHQLFVEGRGARVTDVLIDMSGALLGLAAAARITRLRAWVLWMPKIQGQSASPIRKDGV